MRGYRHRFARRFVRRGTVSCGCEAFESRRLLAAAPAGVAIDTTYGTGGSAWTPLNTVGGVDAAALPSGKLYIAGSIGNVDAPPEVGALLRLSPDGTPDPSFSRDGLATLSAPGDRLTHPLQWKAVVPLPFDKVLVAGGTDNRNFLESDRPAVLARYNPDGSLDTTFGGGDGIVFAATDGDRSTINDVELLPGGKILAGGWVRYDERPDDQGDFGIWRFNADGTPDATFGTAGFRSYNVDWNDAVTSLAVLPDGRFFAETTHGAYAFTADGTMGARLGDDRPGVMALAPSGKLVVAVGGEMGAPVRGITVRRFLSDGTHDPAFGRGLVPVRFGTTSEYVSSLAALPNGAVLVGGSGYQALPVFENYAALSRLKPDGSLDRTFGVDGIQVEPFGGGGPLSMAVGPTGRVYTVGGAGDVASVLAHRLDPGIVADPGGPYGPVFEGNTIDVSGAGSSYTGGTIVKYEWDDNYHLNFDGFRATSTGAAATLRAIQDQPAQQFVLRVTTSDGLQATSQLAALTVRNVPPEIVSATVPRAVVYGSGMTVSGVVEDAGNDPITVRVDFGDGTPVADAPVLPDKTFSATHTYRAIGSYPLRITASDDQGASSTQEFSVVAADVVGKVYRDENDDGFRAATGEGPYAGVTAYADVNNSGVFDAGDRSAVSDANGDYYLTNLPAGRYSIRIVEPAGWRLTYPGILAPFTFGGASGAQRPFGLSNTARIGGTVFGDVNANGVREPAEPALNGFESSVFLDLNDDGFHDASEPLAVRDPFSEFAKYVFRKLQPGTYTVRFLTGEQTLAAEYVQTTPNERGGHTGYVVTVGPGEVAAGRDFGAAFPNNEIQGQVYEDRNGDGVKGANEGLLQNWVVYSDFDNDAVLDPDESRARTSAAGTYLLPVLTGQTYTVRVVVPAGWEQTQPAGGAPYVVTVSPNGAGLNNKNFGVHPTVPAEVVGRYVYYNGSAFASTTLSHPSNDRAIAPDKRALLPAGRAGFENITSFTRGLTGIMVDVRGLSQRNFASTQSPALFRFATSATPDVPASWLPVLSTVGMAVRRGAGVGGSDRVVLAFTEPVRNAWLQVTMLGNEDTGLFRPDVFYFGNLVGEAVAAATAGVNALDLSGVKRALNAEATVASPYDINRDGRVNALDMAAVRSNLNRSLRLFTAPAPPAAAAKRADSLAALLG